MSNETTTADQNDDSLKSAPADAEKTDARTLTEQAGITFASDEKVRLAAEKIFRVHARLFEALAKS